MGSKLFMKYIRKYLGVLGISLILLVPVYIAIYQGTEKLIITETYSKLEQNVADLDNQISKMNIIAELLRSDEYAKRLAKIKGEPASSDSFAMIKTREFLVSCFALRVESFNEYVMFRNNDIVISSEEILSSAQYQNYSNYGQTDVSFEEFHQYVFQDGIAIRYLPLKAHDKSCGIIGILNVGDSNRLSHDTALIFELNGERLNEILEIDEESQTDFAYIANRNGEILYQINYSGEALNQETYQNQKVSLNGQKYTLIHLNGSSGLDWTFGISNKTIEQGIVCVNHIIIIYMMAAVAGMILTCIFWAVQRAVDMNGIMKSLKHNGNGEQVKNEFRYIAREIDDLCNENENYKMKIDILQKSITDSMLEKLLLRGVYSAKEKEEIQDYLSWDMEFYCVVCVSTSLTQEEEILDCFCQVDDFFNRHFTCISLNIGKNERDYMIRMQMDDVPDTSRISEVLKELLLKQYEIRIGISTIGTGLENIQLCYQQAKLMVRQIADVYDVSIKMYREQFDTKEKIFKLNLGSRIYDLILAEEKDSLSVLFEKIRSYAAKSSWHSDDEVMQFFFEIQNPIARVWDEVEQKSVSDRTIPVYRADKTVMELIDALEEAGCYLCDSISREKENSKNALYHEMIRFVEENYANKDMCVSYVAQHLGISDNYLTIFFKEQTGKNFAAYVEAKRMQLVEKYLLETDWSMAKIAEMVGYNTLDTFYKSFKKKYGLAPGKWKENHVRQRENYKN